MGLNAFFTYTVVLEMGYSWQVALGGVFISGIIFVILSIFKIREWIINSIPQSLRYGIAAGIGLFLAFIGLKSAGIIVDNPATLVNLGDITCFTSVNGGTWSIPDCCHGEPWYERRGNVLNFNCHRPRYLVLGDVQFNGLVSTAT